MPWQALSLPFCSLLLSCFPGISGIQGSAYRCTGRYSAEQGGILSGRPDHFLRVFFHSFIRLPSLIPTGFSILTTADYYCGSYFGNLRFTFFQVKQPGPFRGRAVLKYYFSRYSFAFFSNSDSERPALSAAISSVMVPS